MLHLAISYTTCNAIIPCNTILSIWVYVILNVLAAKFECGSHSTLTEYMLNKGHILVVSSDVRAACNTYIRRFVNWQAKHIIR